MTWHRNAACVTADPDLFFSESPTVLATVETQYCARCPVRTECELEGYGQEWGKWGGIVRHRVKVASR